MSHLVVAGDWTDFPQLIEGLTCWKHDGHRGRHQTAAAHDEVNPMPRRVRVWFAARVQNGYDFGMPAEYPMSAEQAQMWKDRILAEYCDMRRAVGYIKRFATNRKRQPALGKL